MGDERARLECYIHYCLERKEWNSEGDLGIFRYSCLNKHEDTVLGQADSQEAFLGIGQLLVSVSNGSAALPVCNELLFRSLRQCETAGFTWENYI